MYDLSFKQDEQKAFFPRLTCWVIISRQVDNQGRCLKLCCSTSYLQDSVMLNLKMLIHSEKH